ncbi:LysR family transcriptional regulator [Hwanghaeella grinnelliae]|uniref:LysR family transcriptional regulator n=2 Tax=Hwanghaeella grinnelliae TaxID=2500179 RepID=A0A437QZ49_9PROT|nr:LysR family transcriptional regulator [Hwanghaeella grinnelliae]
MLPNLTIRQLQTFREVMRTGSISEAGRALGRTQPAISSMISVIETELGFPLFVRDRGRLIPRPEAQYFLEEAEEVLGRLERAQQAMMELSSHQRGGLRIACYPAGSGVFLPKLLVSFLRDRPEVKADLMMRSSLMVEDLVASQEYDIGLAETPKPRPSIQIETYRMSGVVALAADDPLAALSVVTPKDLSGKPLAILFEEHTSTIALREVFREAGAIINPRFTLRTFQPTLELVSGGLCAAVIDPMTVASYSGNGVVFRQFMPRTTTGISILMPAHRPPSQLSLAFHETLAAEMQRLENLTGMPE